MQLTQDHPTDELNGSPEEFPERQEAMEMFELLWMSYLGQWGPGFGQPGRRQHHWKLHVMMGYMEEWQMKICHGPGSLWDEFARGLPGYESYWNSPFDLSYLVHHHE